MLSLSKTKKIARAVVGPVLGICLVVYFGLNLIEGDRGFLAWMRLAHEVRAAEATLTVTDAEKNLIEHRVSLLRPEHLDADMLDERARNALNLIGPNEVVIFNSGAQK